MSIEANKRIVRSYVEAFNAGDFPRLLSFFAPDAQIWGVLGHGPPDAVLPIWRELHEGMNMRLEIQALAAEGACVAARFRETGRFTGPFRGLAGHAPTGRAYEIISMEWFEFEDGRIARRWGARDSAAITRQVAAAGSAP